jgi:hypothetical protein
MKEFFNSLWSGTILAIVLLITLFASGCTSTHVQHVSETPVDSAIFQNLYQCGSDTIIMAFDSTRVNGVGCKSGKSYSELRWNPSHSFTLTKCGPSFDFKKAVGLAHNQELVIREKKAHRKKQPIAFVDENPINPFWTGIGKVFQWILVIVCILLALMVIPWRRLWASARGQYTTAGRKHHTNVTVNRHDETHHHYGPQMPNMEIHYKGEGADAMIFDVIGNFSLPLQITVRKGKEDPTTVKFDRPDVTENKPT